MTTSLVLTTVNAPHRRHIDARQLADCLLNESAARAAAGYMSSFFGDVDPELQVEFARLFGIDKSQLASAARAFAAYSGESYPLAA